jgi:RNA polymerase sigma-70 factor (ECF subfamily)
MRSSAMTSTGWHRCCARMRRSRCRTYALWLRGPAAVRGWLLGRGSVCRGSRLVPTAACGSPAFGQCHPRPEGGHQPWALIVLELAEDRTAGWHSFLDTETLFPRFGLPPRLPA